MIKIKDEDLKYKRDRKLAQRYHYLHYLERLDASFVIEYLSNEEFFITENRIRRILGEQSEYLKTLKLEKPRKAKKIPQKQQKQQKQAKQPQKQQKQQQK